jgi:hypothetical protein
MYIIVVEVVEEGVEVIWSILNILKQVAFLRQTVPINKIHSSHQPLKEIEPLSSNTLTHATITTI